jgi:carbon storage regulator
MPVISRSRVKSTMLVLIRRVGESVMIGSTVKVTVLGVRGGQVRVGVQAPQSLEVHREEVFAQLQRKRSSRADPSTTRASMGDRS